MTFNGKEVPVSTVDEALQVLNEVLAPDTESPEEDQGEPVEVPEGGAAGTGAPAGPGGEPIPGMEAEGDFTSGFNKVRNGGLNGRG